MKPKELEAIKRRCEAIASNPDRVYGVLISRSLSDVPALLAEVEWLRRLLYHAQVRLELFDSSSSALITEIREALEEE
jgi:hypothetical protein